MQISVFVPSQSVNPNVPEKKKTSLHEFHGTLFCFLSYVHPVLSGENHLKLHDHNVHHAYAQLLYFAVFLSFGRNSWDDLQSSLKTKDEIPKQVKQEN